MKLGGAVGSLDGTELGADLGEQAETVAAAFAAISERRTLSFGYRGRDRRVRPYGLVHRRGHWYLVAADIDGEDVKVYRLDRTTALVAGDRAGGDHRGRLAAGIRVAKPGVDALAGSRVGQRQPHASGLARRRLIADLDGELQHVAFAQEPEPGGWQHEIRCEQHRAATDG